jgi:cation transport regulator ChaB
MKKSELKQLIREVLREHQNDTYADVKKHIASASEYVKHIEKPAASNSEFSTALNLLYQELNDAASIVLGHIETIDPTSASKYKQRPR